MVMRLKYQIENLEQGWVFQTFEENIWFYNKCAEDYPMGRESLRDRIEAILTLDPTEL